MLARRGSRPIVVDGHELLWWVRRRGRRQCQHCDECTVTLAHASRTGAIVQVSVEEAWRAEVVPITPGRVAELAREALGRGWVPGQGEGVFASLPLAP
ncbi:hypothetical protein [Nannocystis punicea]|uniref:Transposase n=1 Tax=Nannocystis punicea TaxID=2995304 RepID=A0ABY7GU09_9BACT|nr:hypothetical protein [Nannocystis poenicansa]WAS90442.1 hypothetical protein O0S08_29995 [Nannocystis poenicansa]